MTDWLRQRSLKELFLEVGGGQLEEGLIEPSSVSSTSKLRLQDLSTQKRRITEVSGKKQICSANESLKYEVKKTCFSLSKGCSVPDNLEDVADSSFFLWNVKAIWSRPWQEVLLATIVWYKLQHQENRSNEDSWITLNSQDREHLATSIESSALSRGGFRLIMLAVPSSASFNSFRKTPQKGTTCSAVTKGNPELTEDIWDLTPSSCAQTTTYFTSWDVASSGHNLLVLRGGLVLSHGIL